MSHSWWDISQLTATARVEARCLESYNFKGNLNLVAKPQICDLHRKVSIKKDCKHATDSLGSSWRSAKTAAEATMEIPQNCAHSLLLPIGPLKRLYRNLWLTRSTKASLWPISTRTTTQFPTNTQISFYKCSTWITRETKKNCYQFGWRNFEAFNSMNIDGERL